MKVFISKHLEGNFNWLLFGAIIFYLITAFNSSGFHNADEHFQIIEFANYKLGLASNSDLAWEFNAQIRSGLQPAICYVVFKILRSIGITDVYFLAFILRALTAVFAVLVIKKFIDSSKGSIDKKYFTTYILLSYLLWFMPYVNIRFSSETWSGLFFLLSLSGPKDYFPYTMTLSGGHTVQIIFGTTASDGETANQQVSAKLIQAVRDALNIACQDVAIYSIYIKATTNGQHAPSSNHYKGLAVDISRINGQYIQNIGSGPLVQKLQEAFDTVPNRRENFGPALKHKLGSGLECKWSFRSYSLFC